MTQRPQETKKDLKILKNMNFYPDVSLLITHYNRSKSLENLLLILEKLNLKFSKVVVSDDGSIREHILMLEELQQRFGFQLIKADVNKGLGNNINKGQDVIKTKYTLYIQEDFEPSSLFTQKLADAVSFMNSDHRLDIVRFYAYTIYPYLKEYGKGFSEMIYKPLGWKYKKLHYYSDHPHLRRNSFFERFGRYSEGLSGDETEYRMSVSFIQNKGRGLFFRECYSLFTQNNSQEPSTMVRKSWLEDMSLGTRVYRFFYRQIKYNFDLSFMKSGSKRSQSFIS